MFPIGHIGISVSVGRLFRFNLAVVAFTAILPDLVDKPLWLLGVGEGRFIAHSLLFVGRGGCYLCHLQ